MKKTATLILIVLMAILTAFPAQAGSRYDYSIADAFFDDSQADEGKIFGYWLGAEDKTAYSVKLYKGTRRVMTKQVTATRIDLSNAIVSKNGGAGTYYYTVTPTKGGEDYMITSETLEVTAAMVGVISKRIAAERKAAIAATGGGWMKGPGNIWIFYDKDGTQVKGKWIEDRGHRYYLDKNGIMLTGWQDINKAYYYLEPKGTAEYPMGACWVSTTTPDGFKVDETGARLDETGKKAEAITIKQLSVVALSIKETQEPGSYTQISGISSGSGKVSDITYLTDPAGWTSETGGALTCRLELNSGNILKVNCKASCSRASSVTILSKTSNTMNLEIHYIPKYVLATPENLYITDNMTLHWNKVSKATGYTVKIVIEETEDNPEMPGDTKTTKKTSTYTTEQPIFSLSDHDVNEDTVVKSISISANGPNKKTFIDSKALMIDDLAELIKTRTVNGEFKQTSSGLQFFDNDGEKVTGWKKIAGDWYYFKRTGYAAGPGWYQDPADKNWYYFDNNYHMMTGTIVLEDGTYVLNDGSNPNFPLGAWIH